MDIESVVFMSLLGLLGYKYNKIYSIKMNGGQEINVVELPQGIGRGGNEEHEEHGYTG